MNETLDKFIDANGLYVTESGGRIPYSMMHMSHGFVNYFPTRPVNDYFKDFGILQVLFLPITEKHFKKSIKKIKPQVGFKYLFNSGEMYPAIGKTETGEVIDVRLFQLEVDVHRFAYRVTGENEIRILKVYDRLYPTRLFDIKAPKDELANYILTTQTKCINEMNLHYGTNDI